MQFKDFTALFEELLVLKKQYPILFSYHSYLASLSEQGQELEMNAFVIWLGTNPQINKQILDNPKFVSPTKGKTIFFDVIFRLADKTLAKQIWQHLHTMCKWDITAPSVNLIFNKLQHNSMIKSLISDLDLEETVNEVTLDNLQIEDIDKILFSPQLVPALLKLRQIIIDGKHNYKKFLPLITTTIKDLKEARDLDDNSKRTLGVLDQELSNVSNGKQLNINKVMTTLKDDPLVTQTSFSSFLESFHH